MQDFDFAKILPKFAQILVKFTQILGKFTQILHKFSQNFPQKKLLGDAAASPSNPMLLRH